ncbi:MAG TPA: class I SAM-dependent methyltransferase [Acidimicrobiales bacterium]|nr:class I SAM-dependent methyltransferase [Acidimicrobiales bacterium]
MTEEDTSSETSVPRPADRWRETVLRSSIPQAILDSAPEPEVSLEPERFRWRPEEDAAQPVRPSRRRALEALPDRGTVLDVGVGGGASSLGLVPKVGLIVGVDPIPGMLESFQASAREVGVAVRAVLGSWPDVADQVEPADVAVCHHAMYRVAELEDFVSALTTRARHRVVVELSAHSPLAGLNPLWKTIHGIDRPDPLVADEAQTVLRSMGFAVEREDIVLPPRVQEVTPQLVAFARRRLYVGPGRDHDIEQFLREREPQEQRVAALWWPGTAA